jgi:DNA-binding MarR family transcriptional regulator
MKTLLSVGNLDKHTVDLSTVVPADRSFESKKPFSSGANADVANGDFETFPFQQLLRIARQSGLAEPCACASSMTLLKTCRAVHHCLVRTLKPLGLSEGRFFALVTLYALDPIPSSSADLAYHTEITRPAMTGLLDKMVKRGWVRRRHRHTEDRRFSRVSLTDKGREVTVFAIYRYLKSAAEISGDLTKAQHLVFDKLCAQLRRRSL